MALHKIFNKFVLFNRFGSLKKFYLISLAFLFLSFYFIFRFTSKHSKQSGSQQEKNIKIEFLLNDNVSLDTIHNCNPFLHENIQFYILLNDQIYPKRILLHQNKTINFSCLNESVQVKKILYWTTMYASVVRSGRIDSSCPVNKCEILNDKSLINESDLVVTYMVDKIETPPPSYRPSNQRWVFQMFESPLKKRDFSMNKLKNFYNMMSTYKIGSDFSGIYESTSGMNWELNSDFDENKDFSDNKTKFAAVVVSNCHYWHGRLDYIQELKRFIKVDIYGKCGNHQCGSDIEKCKADISRDYKFYLAFENSICNDYITEKFFYTIKYDIIPVVRGGNGYDNYVPKSAYINAFDFKSPRKLAQYLTYLDSNKTAYNEYFKWKKYVKFGKRYDYLCDMCIHLHLEDYIGIEKKTIDNLEDHWSLQRDCKFY